MSLAISIIAALIVMGAVYAVVIRGSLSLVTKRLEEDTELAKPVPDEKLDSGVPVDVEY